MLAAQLPHHKRTARAEELVAPEKLVVLSLPMREGVVA